MRVATRITVLRDGRAVLPAAPVDDVSLDTLVTAMLGRPAQPPAAATTSSPSGESAVVLTEVTVPDHLRNVSLTARNGEIVGLAGLQGSGHLAVLDVVCGRARP